MEVGDDGKWEEGQVSAGCTERKYVREDKRSANARQRTASRETQDKGASVTSAITNST